MPQYSWKTEFPRAGCSDTQGDLRDEQPVRMTEVGPTRVLLDDVVEEDESADDVGVGAIKSCRRL